MPDLTLLQLRGRYHQALAEAIKAKKNECGLTWRQIADRLKIGQQTVYTWVSGANTPTAANLAALDEIFAQEERNRRIAEREKRGQNYF